MESNDNARRVSRSECGGANRQTSLKYREERRLRPSIVSVPSRLVSWDLLWWVISN